MYGRRDLLAQCELLSISCSVGHSVGGLHRLQEYVCVNECTRNEDREYKSQAIRIVAMKRSFYEQRRTLHLATECPERSVFIAFVSDRGFCTSLTRCCALLCFRFFNSCSLVSSRAFPIPSTGRQKRSEQSVRRS